MSKTKYILSALLALVLTVSVSFMSVGAANNHRTKVSISTKNSVTCVYISGTTISFNPQMFDITDNYYPHLYEFGLRYGFDVPPDVANYFTHGRIAIMCDNFSEFYNSTEYHNLSQVNVSDYQYFTFNVTCAVNDIGHSVERSFLNCGLTATVLPDTQLQLHFEDYITDTVNMRCYTFGVSSLDFSLINLDYTVAQFLSSLELMLYPKTDLELLNSPFTIMLSDISLNLYTAADVINNNISNLEDAIKQSNQEVIDKLDEIYYSPVPEYSHDTVDTSTMDEVKDELKDVNDAISEVLPEYDESILVGIPNDLDPALTYIGSNLEKVIDYDGISGLIFFCLSFGLAMTIIGRATR